MRKLLSIIAFFAILLFMSSCEEEITEEPNPFIGTWESIENKNAQWVYNKTIATGYLNDSIYWTGTYTYDNSKIIVILDQEKSETSMIESWPDGFICEYKFEDNFLLIYNPGLIKFKKLVNDNSYFFNLR
jgi:hypothetical protein